MSLLDLVDRLKQTISNAPQKVGDFLQQYPTPASFMERKLWTSPVGQKLEQAQRFIESPQPIRPFPTFQIPTNASFKEQAGKSLLNLPSEIGNTIFGKGYLNVISDVGQVAGRSWPGRELPEYQNLKSSAGRFGYNISGIANRPKEILGNIAGTLEPIVTAYTPKKVFGIGEARGLEPQSLSLLRTIWEGAKSGGKLGAVFGTLGGLESARDIEDNLKYLTEVGSSSLKGTATGAIMGGTLAGVGHVFGSVVKILKSRIKIHEPQLTEQQLKDKSIFFLRDEATGRYKGSQRINEPKYYGDLRESLGLPRNGDYESGKINLGAEIGGNQLKDVTNPQEWARINSELNLPSGGEIGGVPSSRGPETFLERQPGETNIPQEPVKTQDFVQKLQTGKVPSELQQQADISQLSAEGKPSTFRDIINRWLGRNRNAEISGYEYGKKFPSMGKDEGVKFITSIENKEPLTGGNADLAAQYRQLDDEVFAQAKSEGLDIRYLQDHIAHIWKQSYKEVIDKYKAFKLKYEFSNSRQIPTYEEGLKIGLTPRYSEPRQILAYQVKQLEKMKAGIDAFTELKNSNLIVPAAVGARNPDFAQVKATTFPRSNVYMGEKGEIIGNWYAPKQIAKELEKIFSQEETIPILNATASVSRGMQDITLSGGIPGTPVNAWTAAQTIKETLGGRPLSAIKAVGRSILDPHYLEGKTNVLKEMQQNGYSTSTEMSIDALKARPNIGKGSDLWNRLVNYPTFKRFMPNMEVSFYEDMKASLLKNGYAENEAQKVATKALQNWYGSSDLYSQSLKSGTQRALTTTLFFAPRYRESMINFWVNSVKGIKKPLAPENITNSIFLASSAMVLTVMDQLNRKFNDGKGMLDNPSGKQDKLLIPVAKITGNQEDTAVIGIPWLSSIATMPRLAFRAGKSLFEGKVSESAKDVLQTGSSVLFRPLADVMTNQNYFGNPIVKEGAVGTDRWTQIGTYLANQYLSHPYLRELTNPSFQNDPAYQRLSRAMEMPFRFYEKPGLTKDIFYSAREQQVPINEAGFYNPKTQDIRDLFLAGKITESQMKQMLSTIGTAEKARTTLKEQKNLLQGKAQNQGLDILNIFKPSGKVGAAETTPATSANYDVEKLNFEYSDKKNQTLDNYFWYKDKNNKVKEIDLSFQPTPPTLTGFTELDKKVTSKFNGEITQKANDIYELYQQGQLTEEEADKQLTALINLKNQHKAGGIGRKPAKIAVKKISVKKLPSLKITKIKTFRPIKLAKAKKTKVGKSKTIKIKVSKMPKVVKLRGLTQSVKLV